MTRLERIRRRRWAAHQRWGMAKQWAWNLEERTNAFQWLMIWDAAYHEEQMSHG